MPEHRALFAQSVRHNKGIRPLFCSYSLTIEITVVNSALTKERSHRFDASAYAHAHTHIHTLILSNSVSSSRLHVCDLSLGP